MPPLSSLSSLPVQPSFESARQYNKPVLKNPTNIVSLDSLLKRADIWQASQKKSRQHASSTGYPELDRLLHYQGWPLHSLTEILVSQSHIGEVALVLPSIAKQMQSGGALFLIEPPFIPYAPAWINAGVDINQMFIIRSCQERDWLWASEQIMANKGVACCLFWPPKDHLSNKVLKRLQLASKEGSALNFIFRQDSVVKQSSPASLRLKLHATANLEIEIIKQQGGWAGQQTSIQLVR